MYAYVKDHLVEVFIVVGAVGIAVVIVAVVMLVYTAFYAVKGWERSTTETSGMDEGQSPNAGGDR